MGWIRKFHVLCVHCHNGPRQVMDQGVLLECDSPQALLEDPNSSFSALVDETGPTQVLCYEKCFADGKEMGKPCE